MEEMGKEDGEERRRKSRRGGSEGEREKKKKEWKEEKIGTGEKETMKETRKRDRGKEE